MMTALLPHLVYTTSLHHEHAKIETWQHDDTQVAVTSMSGRNSPQSPDDSYNEPPSLDHIVTHFVAAKRALASSTHVQRANEIVQEGRRYVEHHAVLSSKNAFIKDGVEEEIQVLHSIRGGLETVGNEAQADFGVSKTII